VNARAIGVVGMTAVRRVLAQRGGLGVSIGFYVIVVSVLTGLWRAAAEAHGGTIAGYTGVQLTWYIAATEAATVALNIRMIDDIGTDIGSGAVASELLRPASVLGVRMTTEIGRTLPRLACLAVVGAVLASVLGGAPPSLLGMGLAAISLALATTCNLLAQHAFAGAAFWLRNAGATWFLYQKLVFLLGGMLIPLEALPSSMQGISLALPFQAMAYTPGRLASGHVEPLLLLVQVVWVGVLWLTASAVFRAGERRLEVVGG
jgi:ABC-2 type transport system permease protein